MQFRWYHVAVAGLAILLLAAAIQMIGPSVDRDVLYQVSAMDLFSNGSYGGIVDAKTLRSNGDFGIGTFDGLNGEMIVLNGTVYQAASDGKVHIMGDSATIPFADVTFFDADDTVTLAGHYNFTSLTTGLDEKLSSKDKFYAIRIHGTFSYLKLRSPPLQDEPYPVLSEALKNQSIFEMQNVTGTMVGLYTPAYAKGVGWPGYHFHFISDDGQTGGHVLELSANDIVAALDDTPRFSMVLSP
ncbi:acetolactate decarboxylase [Methanocella paludicola]|nr:acetolactate decarboxylase [Methanocella paludicola]